VCIEERGRIGSNDSVTGRPGEGTGRADAGARPALQVAPEENVPIECPFLMLPADTISSIGFLAATAARKEYRPLLKDLFALAGTCREAHAAVFRGGGGGTIDQARPTTTMLWPIPQELAKALAGLAQSKFAGSFLRQPLSMKQILLGHELLSLRREGANSLLHPSAWSLDLQHPLQFVARRATCDCVL
jgi:hypothetical protein